MTSQSLATPVLLLSLLSCFNRPSIILNFKTLKIRSQKLGGHLPGNFQNARASLLQPTVRCIYVVTGVKWCHFTFQIIYDKPHAYCLKDLKIP